MDEFKELDAYLERKSAPLTEKQKEALAQKYLKEGKAMELIYIEDDGTLKSAEPEYDDFMSISDSDHIANRDAELKAYYTSPEYLANLPKT